MGRLTIKDEQGNWALKGAIEIVKGGGVDAN